MDRFDDVWRWVREHDHVFAWIGGLSLVTLILSAVLVPVLIRRLPADYYLEDGARVRAMRENHPVLRVLFFLLKNLFGGILVVAGLIMLITPGQGVLTILIGLMLMNFPGKRKLELKLVRTRPIRKAITWIRSRSHQEPLILPDA